MRLLLSFYIACLIAMPVAAADTGSPHSVIESTAVRVAERLEGRRDFLADNPRELYALVDEILLPSFDKRYAGFLVLGRKNWQAATAEQRDRFVDVFFDFLVRSYATGLLDFDPDSLIVLPAETPPDGKRYLVKTEMELDTGRRVPVDYRLRLTSAGWKVYDVRIEGVSYLQNYRNQFNAEIDALGLDALITRLETETDTVAISPTDPTQG
ncbi:MAG: ABC transporter substrate-binding protein [Gammaproteobacteria bacterium]|nr:ABC transporter substrate-binding protein [Gammaproteobacteria bacterium]